MNGEEPGGAAPWMLRPPASRQVVAAAAVLLAAGALGLLIWALAASRQLAWLTSISNVLAVDLAAWTASAGMLAWVIRSRKPTADGPPIQADRSQGLAAGPVSETRGGQFGNNNLQVNLFTGGTAPELESGFRKVRAADGGSPPQAAGGRAAGPGATREPDLRDHARARKDAERLSGDAPRRRPSRTRVGDKVAEELEALGPDQAALTIEYAGHPGRAEKLTVALTRMAPEAASATLCRVHARQVTDWLRYMHPYDPERTVRVMKLIGPRRLAAMMGDRSSAEVDKMLARVPGDLAAAIRAELAG